MCQHRRVQPLPRRMTVPLGALAGGGGRRCLPRLGGRLRGARLPAAPRRGAGARRPARGRCACCTCPTCTSRRPADASATGCARWPASSRTSSSTPGDNLAHVEAVPAVLDALGPLLERPGAFVMGSQRLLRARCSRTRCATCVPDRAVRLGKRRLPTEDLRDGLLGRGLGRPGQRPGPGQGRPPRDRAGRHRRRAHPRATATPRCPAPADPSADLLAGRDPRAVPPGARPDGRRRLRRWWSPGTPTAASSASPASARWSPTATCPGGRPRASRPGSRPAGTAFAARLGRPRDLAVRAGPVRLPAGGDVAHAGRPAVLNPGEAGSAARLDLPGSSGV